MSYLIPWASDWQAADANSTATERNHASRAKIAFEQRQAFENAVGVLLCAYDVGFTKEYEGWFVTAREGQEHCKVGIG